ncbi:hypothetical protein [Paenibacillus lutrae]|uniref:Uncharacterized protein n=1 Tax=Paenibacillus lutrae TaxID=2078573 RepID=A0A7X3FFD8_9BACL|nr:hypothetical protein [Paenibacillus lutrae]MVO98600.1 hypothetical protein [Paenibacillus lutrae]
MACTRCPDGVVLDQSPLVCLTAYCTYGGVSYPKIMSITKTVGCLDGSVEVCQIKAGCCN